MKIKVIVNTSFRRMDEIFSPADQRRMADLVEVIWGKDERMPAADFERALPSADVVVTSGWHYGDALDRAERLKAIMDVSGSFPLSLDYEACYLRRIRVLSAAPGFGRQVAEFSLGLAIDAARQISYGDRLMRRGAEQYLWHGNVDTFLLYDQPVGIIGYGGLARALHPLLLPFGVSISVYDPWLSEGYLRRQGLQPVSLEELMSSSKFIFVMAIPSVENRAMLSRELLELIQPKAVLILASRAHVIDFDAATELVLEGRFKLATDVFPIEPLPADHPIRAAEGATLSAHRAGSVAQGMVELGEMVVDDLEAIVKGMPPRRLQMAEPELSMRYTSTRAKSPDST
ncbi:MAG: hydroxyacid dehydrogenase [Chloroflexi bacterium]|nr:hydroxyacid dehydrogenase [Chloroflexota bacterium]